MIIASGFNRRAIIGAVLASIPFPGAASATISRRTFSALSVFSKADLEGLQRGHLPDASSYLNEAIDHAVTKKFDILRIPKGIYRLNGARQGPHAAILRVRSNLIIEGDGEGSVLQVAPRYTDGGDYRVLASTGDEFIENLWIRNLVFDGNASANLVEGSKTQAQMRRAYSINVARGRNIRVTNCRFRNNPGRGVLNFGDNANRPSTSGVLITGNSIENVGAGVAGNRVQNDHSSIYLQCDGGRVSDNHFRNFVPFDNYAQPPAIVTALEIHGSNTLVRNNTVLNYSVGGNAVAQVQNSDSNRWEGNTFHVSLMGLQLCSLAPYRNTNLSIRNNKLNRAIYQGPATFLTTSEMTGLTIENNVIAGEPSPNRRTTWHGIDLCAVMHARIVGNTIRNVQGCGINLESAKASVRTEDVEISGNQIEDVAMLTGSGRALWAISVRGGDAAHPVSGVKIVNNIIRSQSPKAYMRGIYVDPRLKPNEVRLDSNTFDGVPAVFRIQGR